MEKKGIIHEETALHFIGKTRLGDDNWLRLILGVLPLI